MNLHDSWIILLQAALMPLFLSTDKGFHGHKLKGVHLKYQGPRPSDLSEHLYIMSYVTQKDKKWESFCNCVYKYESWLSMHMCLD